ncbi:class I SAM-dependent methyltransferase [Sulfuricurvum sp.]|uniref:class I SAM-dependent methyltransferase n=1 Tax=Sulfuricurvum sp. TaxID=2025608 RepID=UPI003BB529AA
MHHHLNKQFYHKAVFENGFTPQGLGWHSKSSQEVRFHQILSLLPDPLDSVVDAGCGYGDFCLYLRRHRSDSIDYIGLDALSIMVHETKKRTGCEAHVCDILVDDLPKADMVVCSGALNILTKEQSFRFIERCYKVSLRGVVFNFLEGKERSKTYNYLKSSEIQKLADNLGARCIFRRHYYQSDCTVAFYKNKDRE